MMESGDINVPAPPLVIVGMHGSSTSLAPSLLATRVSTSGIDCSSWLEGVPPGTEHEGVRCEDIEKLTFADGTFEIFVTQDVLEHVFSPERAVREIMRVVKPGGARIFTTPKHKALRTTRQRARLEHRTVVHLLPPQYHGDPRNDPRALVTWDYGDDLELVLWQWCGCPMVSYVVRDRGLGLDGEYLDVFVTRKLTT